MSAMTTSVKDELAQIYPGLESAKVAEISTMFRFGGEVKINNGHVTLQAELSHAGAARHLGQLIHAQYKLPLDIIPVRGTGRSANNYVVRMRGDGERFARRIGLIDSYGTIIRGLPPQIVNGSKADAVAAWRGAFLTRGTLQEPGRNTALEVGCSNIEMAYGLGGLARRHDVAYRVKETRGEIRVVIREGDAIATLLAKMGANDAVLRWEALRTEREVHGSANRLANFDDANMRRSADAAVVAVVRVKRAFEILGDEVPANLREAGEYRIQFPEDSLITLGERLTPPATKDAVAGRLRRLNTMADKRAIEVGIPTTLDVVEELERRGGTPL